MKIKNTTSADMTIRGVKFPAGKAVTVDDAALAEKVMKMGFAEVKARAKKNDKNAD